MTGRMTKVAVAALGLAAFAVGCSDDLAKARAAADRANAKLYELTGTLAEVRQQNQQLRDELAFRDKELANKDELVKSLELANADWGKKYGLLKDKYDKLAGQPIADLGGGPVLPPGLDALLRKWADENPDIASYDPRLGMVKLKADLTFEPGMSDLKPAAVAALKKLADILNTKDAAIFHVYAAGHTDDIPLVIPATVDKHGSNWGLSCHRALEVVKSLTLAGVEQRRMAAMGFSMYHPVAPNAPGRKGNPVNRRVELWIVPPEKFLSLSKEAPTPPPAKTGTPEKVE